MPSTRATGRRRSRKQANASVAKRPERQGQTGSSSSQTVLTTHSLSANTRSTDMAGALQRVHSRQIPTRLLHTKDCELWKTTQVIDHLKGDLPSYAILSHTWLGPSAASPEVTFHDMQASFLQLKRGELKRAGWGKLTKFCEVALKDKFEWAWMDTCCIDKSSDTDTQKAINAMFQWYQNATICYVYLEDVQDSNDMETSNPKWFTRGWTLQEFIAPSFVQFLGNNWKGIGTRDELNKDIKRITQFDPQRMSNFRDCSVSEKLSWAAKRQTTVIEDEAYCLLGLFGISMSLTYGEGRRAFLRLQEALYKLYDDETIFTWTWTEPTRCAIGLSYKSFLAPSIHCFSNGSEFTALDSEEKRPGFAVTSQGLQLPDRVIWSPTEEDKHTHDKHREFKLVELNCRHQSATGSTAGSANKPAVAMLVHRPRRSSQNWRRSFGCTLATMQGDSSWKHYGKSEANQSDSADFIAKYTWTRVSENREEEIPLKTDITIMRFGHSFEMPRLTVVRISYTRPKKTTMSAHDEYKEEDRSDYDGLDAQGESFTEYNKHVEKPWKDDSQTLALLHEHLKAQTMTLTYKGKEKPFTVIIRSSGPVHAVASSPEFGVVLPSEVEEHIQHWQNGEARTLQRTLPLKDEEGKACLEVHARLFPVPASVQLVSEYWDLDIKEYALRISVKRKKA